MPVSRNRTSLAPTWIKCLRIGVFTVLGIAGVILALILFHIAFLPLLAWLFPFTYNFFYDFAVFGAYPTTKFISFDLLAPSGIITRWNDRCDDGYVFLGPNGKSVASPGPMILDSHGELIWASDEYDIATNVRVQQYKGEDYITFWAGHKKGSLGAGTTYMLDSTYNIAHRIHAVGQGLKADLHEFQLTEDGTALITIYNTTSFDLRPMGWGRAKEGWIEDCMFQEVDIATGELLFQWRAQDHFKPEDSYYWHPFGGYVESIPFDFYHINSIEKDSKGNYLISSRHFHHLAYINGTSGEPIWILGGSSKFNAFSDLSDGDATGFQWQHHGRWVSEDDKIISIMDNGIAGPLHVDAPYSKGLLVQLDTDKMTAKLLTKYCPLEQVKAASQGNIQILPNGNMLVGWGSSAAWSEHTRGGELLCEAHFAASWSFWWERVKNYRIFKHHDWVGRPDYPPNIKVKDDKAYVSWNGATEVKFWQMEGSRQERKIGALDDDREYQVIEVVQKQGFESTFKIPGHEDFRRLRVVALDKDRQSLGVSHTVEMGASGATTFGIVMAVIAGIAALLGGLCLLRSWIRWKRDGTPAFNWEQNTSLFSGDYRYNKL